MAVMSLALPLRPLLLLLATFKHWNGPLKRLRLLWRFLSRLLWARCMGREDKGSDRFSEKSSRGTSWTFALRPPFTTETIEADSAWRPHQDTATAPSEVVAVCESRRPLSALELQLDSSHNQFLQPGDVPTRPVSMVSPSLSPSPVQTSGGRLHPYSAYTHSNGSGASNVSISVQSTSDIVRRGRHFEVAHPRPDALPTSRAAARGITRVASRAPSRASRSCSRAPSRTPLRSAIDLPLSADVPITAPTNGSQHTLAVPDTSEAARPTPSSARSISLIREEIYPIMAIPRYDGYDTISPERGHWKLHPVTTEFPL